MKTWDDIELHEWVQIHKTQKPDGVFCVRVANSGDSLEFCIMPGVKYEPPEIAQREACLGSSEYSALVLEGTRDKVKLAISPGEGVNWMPKWMFHLLATSRLPYPAKRVPFRVVH